MSLTTIEFQEYVAATGIAGVRRIYTSAGLPREVYARDLPVLMPDPTNAVEVSENTPKTIAGRTWQRRRVFNYVCLVGEAGAGRGPADYAEQMAQVLDAVENALCDLTGDGLHSVLSVTVSGAGLLTDATGKQFHGFTAQVAALMSY